MFGNRMGWGISGVIVLIFVALLYMVAQTQVPSPPANLAIDPLGVLALPVSPDSVVTTMTDPGDAADKYREVIDDVEAHPADYKRYNKDKTPSLKGVLALVEAGHLKEMHLFSKKPSEILNYRADKDAIDDLVKAGTITAAQAAVLRNAKKYDEANRYGEAVFSLGVKLFNERVTYEELEAGLGMLSLGARTLETIATEMGETLRASQFAAFQSEMKSYDEKHIKPLHQFTHTIDSKTLGKYAGNVFALAEHSKEPMWRVEAMLQLGRMRYYVGDEGRAADQRNAMRLLRQYSEESEKDPVVRAAATMGRDLDVATYNNQTASAHPQ